MGIGPFTSEVSQTLKLKNPHSDPVAFKVCGIPGRTIIIYSNMALTVVCMQVKTTAPKQ